MRTLIIGVDPGIKGAVGVLELTSPTTFKFVDVFDLPTNKTNKGLSRINPYDLSIKLGPYSLDAKLAVIEEVGFMKGKEARGAAFTLGFATGLVTGVISSLFVPIHTVTPNIWKLSMGLSSDKSLSITTAKRLIPESQKHLTLKQHDGRAEALLLAVWGIRNMRRAA
jgi:crossover junction endodeoxyribonuclease RuvC